MKRILKKIVKELSAIDDVKLVILYGSFARGDYGPKSDIDLFILITKEDAILINDIQNKIINLEEKIGRSVQPVIRTEKELKKNRYRTNSKYIAGRETTLSKRTI